MISPLPPGNVDKGQHCYEAEGRCVAVSSAVVEYVFMSLFLPSADLSVTRDDLVLQSRRMLQPTKVHCSAIIVLKYKGQTLSRGWGVGGATLQQAKMCFTREKRRKRMSFVN